MPLINGPYDQMTRVRNFNHRNLVVPTSKRDSETCLSPFCDKRIEPAKPGKWRRTPRRFCSDDCKLDHLAFVRVAPFLKKLEPKRVQEIFKRRREPEVKQ